MLYQPKSTKDILNVQSTSKPSSPAAILAHLSTHDIADSNPVSVLLIRLANATRSSCKTCTQNREWTIGCRTAFGNLYGRTVMSNVQEWG
jgi:hypothetical protein